MNLQKLILALCLVVFFSLASFAQTDKTTANSLSAASKSVKSSPAYAELLLRKVELESEVESLLVTYKEDYPKVKEANHELGLIQKDLEKLLIQTDAVKLTLALGKLMVRKNELETDYWALQTRLGDEHPDVKRAKKKILSFENAIKEILG
ncbi:MAG: hypothetical protein K1X72_16095 [Pyrinomonadaceae bacterium]|nr:hypothetical protein [Pyrinomonadaceae bacterium]